MQEEQPKERRRINFDSIEKTEVATKKPKEKLSNVKAKPIMVSIGKNSETLYLLKLLALKHQQNVCSYLESLIYQEGKKCDILNFVDKK